MIADDLLKTKEGRLLHRNSPIYFKLYRALLVCRPSERDALVAEVLILLVQQHEQLVKEKPRPGRATRSSYTSFKTPPSYTKTARRTCMSDVTCATCREPWDTYHMRHEALSEVCTNYINVQAWDGKLDSGVVNRRTARDLLADDGWAFGSSIYDIRHCPCCPKGTKAEPNPLRDELVGLMAGDDDGVAAMLEDLNDLQGDS